jgi:hypothetical protein
MSDGVLDCLKNSGGVPGLVGGGMRQGHGMV